jgi:hypothetical protein
MLVVGGLLIVAAIPVAIVGFNARSEASDERAKAIAARHARPPLEARRHSLDQQRVDLQLSVLAMPNKVQVLGTAAGDLAAAQRQFTEVANHTAADNTGDIAGAANVFRNRRCERARRADAEGPAAQQALQDAHAALQKLQDAK